MVPRTFLNFYSAFWRFSSTFFVAALAGLIEGMLLVRLIRLSGLSAINLTNCFHSRRISLFFCFVDMPASRVCETPGVLDTDLVFAMFKLTDFSFLKAGCVLSLPGLKLVLTAFLASTV